MKFATLDLWIIAIYCVGLISLATWVSKSNGKEKPLKTISWLEDPSLGGLLEPH